jgi:uncharacterized protein YndB with AHSA1/START domain
MLKKILIGLVVLVTAFAVVVALQPAEFRVSRTATIAAPAADVFGHVNDLRKWDAWSPWAKLDPAAKVGFEGPEAGKGAVFTWSGNGHVGEGRMTVAESRPGELVALNVDFTKPFEGRSTSEFAFKPEGGGTAVTWTMGGHHDFIGKAMCLIFNGRKMMGGEMEKGLANLKAVVEGGK